MASAQGILQPILSKSPAKSYIKKLLLRYSSDDMMIASKRRGLRD